jgi:hypothetical protein
MRVEFHEFRGPKLPHLMSDEHALGCFTLSYIKFPYSPDVFPSKFVIIYSWTDDSRGEGR